MDAYFRFSCPNPACGKRLKAAPEQAGRRARCSCGQSITIPAPERPLPDLEVEAAAAELVAKPFHSGPLAAVMNLGKRGIPALQAHFTRVAGASMTDDQSVLECIARNDPSALWPWLAPHLQKAGNYTLTTIVEVLVRANCVQAGDAILGAAKQHPAEVESALRRVGGCPEGAAQFLARLTEQVAAVKQGKLWSLGLESKSEDDLVAMLREICTRWVKGAVEDELEFRARAVGAELNRRGGEKAMLHAHGRVGVPRAARTLERAWGGIGSWQG